MHKNKHELKVLMLDGTTGFYRMQRYRVGDFFGSTDLGIHLAYKHNALTTGAELLVAKWEMEDSDVVGDSMHNAELGMALLDRMTQPGGNILLQFEARKFAYS